MVGSEGQAPCLVQSRSDGRSMSLAAQKLSMFREFWTVPCSSASSR